MRCYFLEMKVLIYVGIVAASFLIGALPFSWFLGRMAGIDLRRVGSGNPGATNLYRAAGARWGIPGFLLDVAKGVTPVAAAQWLFPHLAAAGILAAAAAISGHIWTPFLGFRGGKGVATAAGAFLALEPLLILIAFAVFLVVVAATRYVSLGSLSAAVAVFVASFALPLVSRRPVDPYFIVFCGVCSAAIVYAHRRNISRLLAGTESKLGGRKKDGG
ncbi:MAG TPA: glycerol-3-phosphate 1-O-acyltransferase PlsY [bacterium]|nr:glycerol-3-phosphate 1-O-acyltransferase PlsY [bacterium]